MEDIAIGTARHKTPIADEIAKLRSQLAGQAPSEVMTVFEDERRMLDAAGVPPRIAQPPMPFPEADLLDAAGDVVSVRAVLADRTTVVVFYRGAWCPYCNIALRAYRQLLPELSARGVSLVAVSPQKPDAHPVADEADELPFTVLSDPGSKLADALGIRMTPTDTVATAQAQLGLDLREVNADGTAALPMPTVALVDPDGVLQWIDVHPDYTTRTEPSQIIAALDTASVAER